MPLFSRWQRDGSQALNRLVVSEMTVVFRIPTDSQVFQFVVLFEPARYQIHLHNCAIVVHYTHGPDDPFVELVLEFVF